MTSRDFAFWLQGYLEINAVDNPTPRGLSPEQVVCVQKHLALVFKHDIDPSAGPPAHQAELDAIHVGDTGPAGASTHDPLAHRKRPPRPDGALIRC